MPPERPPLGLLPSAGVYPNHPLSNPRSAPENDKKIASTQDQKIIRMTPPIERNLESLESNKERSGNHHFGRTDQDVVLRKTGHFSFILQ